MNLSSSSPVPVAPSRLTIPVTLLVAVAVLAAAICAAVGLFTSGGPGPRTVATIHGASVELYGRGLYAMDSSFKAPVQRGTDLVVLAIAAPLALAALARARAGGTRPILLLAGALVCLVYYSASLAFGVSYNPLFLAYVAAFGLSAWSLALVARRIDLAAIQVAVGAMPPRRGAAAFMLVASLSPLVWLIDIVAALAAGGPPRLLGAYTTDITTVIDLGLITPACVAAGVGLFRRRAAGVALAVVLLELLVLIGLVVVGQTALQYLDGIVLSPGEYLAYVGSFVGLAAVAVFFLGRLLRVVPKD